MAKPHVLIAGAGSMGLVTGYHLGLAGAEVSYLIRPKSREALDRPQILYCLDDNTAKEFTGYSYITDPSEILKKNYDYIVVTLDRTNLQSNDGTKLVQVIGGCASGKSTKVILGTVGIGILSWFLKISCLTLGQVTNGVLGVECYPPKLVDLAIRMNVDQELLARADAAYVHCYAYGFVVDDSSPETAQGFAELYNKCLVSRCTIRPAQQYGAELNPLIAVYAGCELMKWPKFSEIDVHSELWRLTTSAVKEVQGLNIHGEAGRIMQAETTEESLAAALASREMDTLPLELQEFNRYHHGGKVNAQDRMHLRACLTEGLAEGKNMSALKELLAQWKPTEQVISQ